MATVEVRMAILNGTYRRGLAPENRTLSFEEVVRLIEECRITHPDVKERRRAVKLLARMARGKWTFKGEASGEPPDIEILLLDDEDSMILRRSPHRNRGETNSTGRILRIIQGVVIKLESRVSEGGLRE